MTTFRSDLLRELEARGFIHQCTDAEALDALAAREPITGYIGFDCTADSLHVGNLVSIMLLRTMQRTGHRPLALVGGGTTKVGDPSGKDESRQLLTEERIAANKAGISRSLAKFVDLEPRRWHPGRQCRVAGPAPLHPLPARLRHPLHRQPHADLRLGPPAARARAAADPARVQLHGDAGLRLPRARPPIRVPAADGRIGSVGEHRQRRGARAPDRQPPSLRARPRR